MTNGFVVDASVAIAWVHPGQATDQTAASLRAVFNGAPVFVPALWSLEVANALLVLERRGKLASDERKTALGALKRLSVRVDHEMSSIAFTELSALAKRHTLSVYDAVYLELAQRQGLPLACKDGPLLAAASRCGVEVV